MAISHAYSHATFFAGEREIREYTMIATASGAAFYATTTITLLAHVSAARS